MGEMRGKKLTEGRSGGTARFGNHCELRLSKMNARKMGGWKGGGVGKRGEEIIPLVPPNESGTPRESSPNQESRQKGGHGLISRRYITCF
jgi:hypothetical protein